MVHNAGGRSYDRYEPHPCYSSYGSRPERVEDRGAKRPEPTFPSSSNLLTTLHSVHASTSQTQIPSGQSLFGLSTTKAHVPTGSSIHELNCPASVLNSESAKDYGYRASSSASGKGTLSGVTESWGKIDDKEPISQDELFRREIARRNARQTTRAASCGSSVFDSTSLPSSVASTAYTAPSLRPPLPTYVTASRVAACSDSKVHTLPCEFVGYHDCGHSFALDETDQWIEHCIVHLQDHLPMICMCWYCDDILFDARQLRQDKQSNFRDRMEHIRDHIRDEHYTAHDMRPDFYFLEHLRKYGLITEAVHYLAREWNDSPVPFIGGLHNHNFKPPEMIRAVERLEQVIVDHSREDRQRRRRSRSIGTNLLHSRRHTTVILADPEKQIGVGSIESLTEKGRNQHNDRVQEFEVYHDGTAKSSSLGDTPLVHSSDIGLSDPDLESDSRRFQHDESRVEPKLKSVDGIVAGCEQLNDVHIAHSPQSSRSSICLSRTSSSNSTSDQSPAVKQRKQEMVDRLTIYVTELLRSKFPQATDSLGFRVVGATNQPSSSDFSSSGTGVSAGALSQFSPSGKASKKRKTAADSGGEGVSDDDTPQHEPSTHKGKEKAQLRFACPYFKHDPTKYGSWQNCCGPGWPDVHRVKLDQHNYSQ